MADFTEVYSLFPQSHRLLEDDAIPPNDSEVLRNTFMVYGSALICIFLLFCFVRQKFPKPYKLRSWVEDLKVNTFEMMRDQHYSIWAVPTIRKMCHLPGRPRHWRTSLRHSNTLTRILIFSHLSQKQQLGAISRGSGGNAW
jgi:hypothetical protein